MRRRIPFLTPDLNQLLRQSLDWTAKRCESSRLFRAVSNEHGQISVFIALIFQVLFVFFAMVVNIGMVVHDKINLQNAVDLGAYYAAQRQAEILNEIAHINYQIRQDYKLLTWRYRVLGTLGRVGTSNPVNENPPFTSYTPARRPQNIPLRPDPWNYPTYGPMSDGGPEMPFVCVTNDLWSNVLTTGNANENRCFNAIGAGIPRIPRVTIIAPFVPGISAIAAFAEIARQNQSLAYAQSSPMNWAMTMQMMVAFKMSIAVRKAEIRRLRADLVKPGDTVDRLGGSVRQGVINTIMNNLSESNKLNFNQADIQIMNGLNSPNVPDSRCAAGEFPGANTIQEIRTSPMLYYLFFNSLTPTISPHEDTTGLTAADLNTWDPSGLMRMIAAGEPPLPTDPLFSILGFEKNPWCMAYVGVKAKTSPRQPFAPFSGSGIPMEARAFAQPFGGRIGPWYKNIWPRNSEFSSGDERVDPHTTPRVINGAIDMAGSAETTNYRIRLPNYSRYPGDQLGLKAEVALGAQRKVFIAYNALPFNQRLNLRFFGQFHLIPRHGDPLSWDPDFPQQDIVAPTVKPLRDAEIAAIAPDLFDATYYSIEPDYYRNYLFYSIQRNRFDLPNLFGVPAQPIPDIGGRNQVESLQRFSISDQIALANAPTNGVMDDLAMSSGVVSYLIRDWKHLLTGWVSRRVQTFTFPDDKFGKCSTAAHQDVMIPGRCVAGGRTGYSVRLISREHLINTSWAIGGPGQQGKIWNAPDPSW